MHKPDKVWPTATNAEWWVRKRPGAHLSSALRLVTPSFRRRCTCASFSVCGLLPVRGMQAIGRSALMRGKCTNALDVILHTVNLVTVVHVKLLEQ